MSTEGNSYKSSAARTTPTPKRLAGCSAGARLTIRKKIAAATRNGYLKLNTMKPIAD